MKSISICACQLLTILFLSLTWGCVISGAVDLSPELASYATEFDPELAGHPALAPEECAKQSPEEMYKGLEEANGRRSISDPARVDGISSLAGEDQFYLAYAHQLRIQTDHDDPQIKTFRKPLLKSFQLCMQYIAELYHYTTVRHEHAKVPARVEWMLFQGAHTNYHYVENSEWEPFGAYDLKLIEQIGLAMGHAMVRSGNPDYPFATKIQPYLEECLTSLADAEKHMTESQKKFFRRRLVLFMARYL